MKNESHAPPRHFTVQTLAARWEVSPSHIYNLLHSNALPHLRIGKAIRIPIHFVKEFEDAACQKTTTFINSGNIQTDFGTSPGQNLPTPLLASARGHPASQRQRQIERLLSNTGRNSSQS